MEGWLDVAAVDELPPGSHRVLEVDGRLVAVFNVGGEYHAIEDVCTHDGGVLSSGTAEGEEIVCPRHGARFSLITGAVLGPPAYEDVRTYPVRVSAGRIQVRTG